MHKYYSFEFLQNIFKACYNFRNKLKDESNKLTNPYPWLEPNDPRGKITENQIIESTVTLNLSCLPREE